MGGCQQAWSSSASTRVAMHMHMTSASTQVAMHMHMTSASTRVDMRTERPPQGITRSGKR